MRRLKKLENEGRLPPVNDLLLLLFAVLLRRRRLNVIGSLA